MELYLLRHGIAEDHGPDGDDASRRLTDEGRAKLEAAGAGLARLRVRPELLLSSPLARAYQTAQIVGAHLGLTPQVAEALAPGCSAAALLALLAEHPRAGALMTVGHEPDISAIIAELTGGRVEVKKGALARLDLAPGTGQARLAWLVPPRGLR